MLIGQQVGPFEIETDVGNGAMGTVYRAKWQKDGQVVPVALKVISFGLLGNDGAMARFEREAIILKQLRHPHIVRLYATGRIKQTPFIAMEFVDGESLDKILARRGRLFWEDVISYGRQLCAALQHAHEKGIIHRDLKPSNLMVTADGTLKLTDFGIAKDQDVTSLTGANSTIGTSAYMSPEQCKGDRNLTTKSDLYSLGIVFYELLTGKKPFEAETTVEMFLKHVHEVPVRPCKIVPDLPVWMDNLVMFLLEKDKDHRPIDAATVGRMLADVEEKVAQQQSVGAEMANARRVDRPLGERGIHKSDLEIARELRSPGKRRKKRKAAAAVPWYTRTWLRAAVLLLALSGLGAVAVVLVLRGGDGGTVVQPESMADAWKQVMQSDEPSEKKLQTTAAFLRKYDSDPDPKVEQVRALYRDLRAERAEEILLKRYYIRGLKNNYDGFDEEAYGQAILALDAEKDSKLPEAARHWNDVRKLQEKFEPHSLPISGESQHEVLGWVAARHLRLIQTEIPNTLKTLRAQLADDRTFERVREYPTGSEEGHAVRALRAEQFGDAALAKATWEALAKQTERDAAARKWYLLGVSQAASVKIPAEADIPAKRLTRLEAVLKQLHAIWTKVQADPEAGEARLARRGIRNACRDIIALYASDPDESMQRNVADARKLLETVPQ